MQNQPSNVAALLNPPLGKKPNLSEKEMKNMRMVLQSVTIQKPTKNTYFYNIVQKESNWGFSSHQRLLILNIQGRSISYLSAIPQGYLPYSSYEELTANKVKQKVTMTETKQFRCNVIKGKISSMSIQWVDRQNNEKKWIFTLGSSKLMNDWVGLINSVKDNSFDKHKYDEMNRINNDNLLIGNGGGNVELPPHMSTGNNNNNAHSFMNNPSMATGNNGQKQPTNTQPVKASQLGSNNNPHQTNPNNNPNDLKQSNSQQNPFKQQNYTSPNNLNTNNNNNNLPLPLVQNSNVKPNTQQQPSNNNSYQTGQSDFSKKNKIPQTNTNNLYQPSNKYTPNNFGSNNTQQPMRNSLNTNNNYEDKNFRTSYAPKAGQQSIPILSKNIPYSNNVDNINNSNSNLKPYETNMRPDSPIKSNQNLLSNPNSRTLNPSQSQPADFVQELKRKRQKNPQRFILNNQLSQKKFQDPNYEPQSQYQYPAYYQSNQANNYGTTPVRTGMGERVPSQNYFNRENSGEKKLPYLNSEAGQSPQKQQEMVKTFSRTKINPNIQSSKDLTPLMMLKNPSRSQLSSSQQKLQGVPSSGGDNNYDGNQMLQDDEDRYNQLYKPNTSFPQSTKNLNKIRSDYLKRKVNESGFIDSRVEDNKIYPYTSKNQGRMLINDDDVEDDNQTYYQQQLKNQQQFDKRSKFESNQRKREDSLHNLSKVNSAYLSNKNYKSCPSYNELWLQTSNPNKKIQVYDQFINRSRQLVKAIVEEIPFPTSNREFQPIDASTKQNMYTFALQNMVIKLHFFNQQDSVNGSQDDINVDAPVLYNHSTYQEIKRQFYNYNLILGVTGNQGKIKVPLACYIEYRGILAVVKADIPQAYRQIQPYSYRQQFEALQNMTKVRFMFNTFNCYQSQGYRGGQGKFIMLWNLVNLIPGIPNGLKNDTSYFRKQLLLQYDQILEDLECSSQAHAFTQRHLLPELLTKLQSLEIQILHSKDLAGEFHRAGLSLSYLPQMYKQTQSLYLKRIFMSEIVTEIFTQVVRSQLNHAFSILPAENMQHANPKAIDNVIVSCAHILINQFFSYTQRSQSIWKLIVKETSKRYRMIVSKQDVIPGYILSGIVHKLSLQSDFKQKAFLKHKKFFIHENILPREVFLTFSPRVRRFDMQSICPTYSKCKQLIENDQLSAQNYDHLAMILNLKNRQSQLPQYYSPIMQQLKTYLANFIPYTMQQQYQKLDVYQFMYQQPITYNGIRIAFLAIKWLIKANQIQKANQVFQIKFHELSYWLNQYNTAITQFYDFFSMFYASVGDFQQSICLAKSSLINITKVLGQGALPVADKHYQLGNIYFKVNKKNQALKQYNKTKQILINHQKTTIPQYGIILLKISLLCLNFGQLTECLSNAIQAQRIFQNNGGNENQEVECFEILARVYQITRKQSDMGNLCEACSKTFNTTENPKVMERMLKIIAYAKITQLSSQQQKSLLPILAKLYQQRSPSSHQSYLQSFNYLHKLAMKHSTSIKKKLYNYLQNVLILSEEVNRRDLMRKHVSFNQRATGEAEQMLVMIEAVGNMVGWNFLIGMVKQPWYD